MRMKLSLAEEPLHSHVGPGQHDRLAVQLRRRCCVRLTATEQQQAAKKLANYLVGHG
jgi:hypothetical protein